MLPLYCSLADYCQLRSFLKQATYPASLRSLHIVPSRPLPAASASAGLSSKQSRLIKHIKKNAPDLIEIRAVIQKSISWRDMYTRRFLSVSSACRPTLIPSSQDLSNGMSGMHVVDGLSCCSNQFSFCLRPYP